MVRTAVNVAYLVCSHADVLEDECSVQEQHIAAVCIKGCAQGAANSSVGSSLKGRANVDLGLVNSSVTQGGAQENNVGNLVLWAAQIGRVRST